MSHWYVSRGWYRPTASRRRSSQPTERPPFRTALSRVSLEELSYDVDVGRQRAEIGETVPITVSLVNRKLLPQAWVKVEDRFPDAVEVWEGDAVLNSDARTQSLRHLTSNGWYERIRWDYTISCTRRGLHQMGPAIIESGDPFGFIRTRKVEEHQSSILVMPRTGPPASGTTGRATR
jgi:uncharacterized protein (DUF58 family)